MIRRIVSNLSIVSLIVLVAGCGGGILGNIDTDANKAPALVVTASGDVVLSEGTVTWVDTYQSDTNDLVIIIENNGDDDLELFGIDRIDISPGDRFEIDAQPDSPIVAGGTETVTVTFTPGGQGTFTETCTINTNIDGGTIFTFSLTGTGIADPETPVPTDLTATSGTSTSSVTLTWTPVSGATYYKVYRYPAGSTPDTDDIAAETLLGGSQDSWEDDTVSCVPGTVYDYYVRANSTAYGLGDFSSAATGYRALSAVTGVDAGWGTDTAGVTVNWTEPLGAQTYDIYRSTAPTCPGSPSFTGKSEPFTDTSAVAGTRYYYWVRARGDVEANPGPVSSSYDEGCRGLLPPSDLALTSNPWEIGVSWDPASGATGYNMEKSAYYIKCETISPGVYQYYDDSPYWTDYLPYNGVSSPHTEIATTSAHDGCANPSNWNSNGDYIFEFKWGEVETDHKYRIRSYNSDLDIYSDWYEDTDTARGYYTG